MPTNTFHITGVSRVTYEHVQGATKSKHLQTDFFLEVSDNLDKSAYISESGYTKLGSKNLTLSLIQGLVGNIHDAHERKCWDSAEHLRYIIEELQRGFAAVACVSTGEF